MPYKDWSKKQEYFADRKRKMKVAGICTHCCKNKAENGSMCQACRDKARKRLAIVRGWRRRILNRYKVAHGCAACGYRDHPAALVFHHMNDDKDRDLANMIDLSGKRFIQEILKCQVLCANCHMVLHIDKAAIV